MTTHKISEAVERLMLFGENESRYFHIEKLKSDTALILASHKRMREALEKAVYELNAIRARDGAPQHIDWHRGQPLQTDSCTHEHWNALTEQCFAALSDEVELP